MIERVPTNIQAASAEFVATNPLGKVPALVTDEGCVLYDSPVICEYLDSLHDGAPLFPSPGKLRWQALRRQALADGIADAAVLCRMELSARPEPLRWAEWVERQRSKIERALDELNAESADNGERTVTIGDIAVGCALGYLDFRFETQDWRGSRPALAGWYASFAQRPSMQASAPYDL
ncbi:MAG: glutathione S-transferase family protein [Rhodospirillales bacterium]|nr:glutathione S-transferase family protein [Rhodospirillales bacterium]